MKGVVTNKTTNKPDAGDVVVLVALTQNMQDVAHTKGRRRRTLQYRPCPMPGCI